MSKNFKYESDGFGKMQMGCDWEVVDVKFTSQDICDNTYFSFKALSAKLPESVIEALHDELNIVLVVDYSLKTCSEVQTFLLMVGDLKPSHFPLQNLLLCRHFTSEISEIHHDFTINYLINSCGLSPEGAILVFKRVGLRSPLKPDFILSFIRNHGFSKTQISKMVRMYPQILNSNSEKTLLPKLEFFTSLGVSEEDLATTLEYEPMLLARSLEKHILPTYNFLRRVIFGGKIASVFKNCSMVFLEGHYNNVERNIRSLKESGMPQSCISLLVAHFTQVLMQNPKKFAQVVGKVKQMRFDMEKSMSVMAIKALSSANNKFIWTRNCEVYKRWGWSEDHVLSAFTRYPHCMTKSEKKIMQVMEFVVNKMGLSSQMIVKAPMIMRYNLEKRIIPWFLVVKILMLKGLMDENRKLGSVLCFTEKQFLERFVTRYRTKVPQLLSVSQGKTTIQDV
ncbi:transcription termination factor MTERF6, chloroplastic/mitochondrial-like [Pyrus communis]|uniref:transcription termination factor MTERF6, chloroplastic/mitochondrial-like n=1 Tax=Pyrus communis TaxID=23211 RepID=UPI0035BF1114